MSLELLMGWVLSTSLASALAAHSGMWLWRKHLLKRWRRRWTAGAAAAGFLLPIAAILGMAAKPDCGADDVCRLGQNPGFRVLVLTSSLGACLAIATPVLTWFAGVRRRIASGVLGEVNRLFQANAFQEAARAADRALPEVAIFDASAARAASLIALTSRALDSIHGSAVAPELLVRRLEELALIFDDLPRHEGRPECNAILLALRDARDRVRQHVLDVGRCDLRVAFLRLDLRLLGTPSGAQRLKILNTLNQALNAPEVRVAISILGHLQAMLRAIVSPPAVLLDLPFPDLPNVCAGDLEEAIGYVQMELDARLHTTPPAGGVDPRIAVLQRLQGRQEAFDVASRCLSLALGMNLPGMRSPQERLAWI